MKLSKHFSLADLTVTNTGLQNYPDVFAANNLKKLALILDLLYDTIGPFKVNSAYRSSSVNGAVGGSDGSLHLRGMAADIQPYNMSADAYFRAIAKSSLRFRLGEIINEANEKGVVHVSLPYEGGTSQLKYLENGNYYSYSQAQINSLTAGSSGGGSLNPIIILALSTVLGGAAFLFSRRKRGRKNR